VDEDARVVVDLLGEVRDAAIAAAKSSNP